VIVQSSPNIGEIHINSGNLFKQSFSLFDLIEKDFQKNFRDSFHSKESSDTEDPEYKLKKQKLLQERNVKESLIGITQIEQRHEKIQVERWTNMDVTLTILVVLLIFCIL